MFSKIERKATAEFDLCAAGPVLVSSGTNNERDPRLPDSVFLTGHDGSEVAYVIPGSSIKGAIRHYVHDSVKNGYVNVDEEELFGRVIGKSQKSKASFHDAYADMPTVETNIIFSNCLDPILQKSDNLNNVLAVEKGVFKAGFSIVNYKKDELLAVLYALQAINEGALHIGGRTSRGFGVMRIENLDLTLTNGYDSELRPIVIGKHQNSVEECIREVKSGGKDR